MIPWLAPNDLKLFYKYLDDERVQTYFEFGSGGSTYQAARRPHIQRIFSVESDREWFKKVRQAVGNDPRVDVRYHEMHAVPRNWGHPGPQSTPEQRRGYSECINLPHIPDEIDLILVDGRFRVASCLKSFAKLSSTGLVIFDDFLNRPNYFAVMKYYDIIDMTTDRRLVVLRKKPGIDEVPEDVIRSFEQDAS